MARQFALSLLLFAALATAVSGDTPAANPAVNTTANPTPVNLDFESGSPGEIPPGWVPTTAHFGYTAVLSADKPKQGKQSVRLSGVPTGAAAGERPFGNVRQKIDATPYRGKRVRFRAAVRVEGENATAGLWLRADRPAKQVGFLETMQARPITAPQWAYYELAGDVAADAESLLFGLMLYQEGSAWLDDVTIEVVPNLVLRSAPPRAVSARGMENLIAFTRLYGVVRHFHASDEAAAADWDAVAVNGVAAVEGAADASELALRLNEIFLPLAPSMRIHNANVPPQPEMKKPGDAVTIVAWEHVGLGEQQGNVYSSGRVRRSAAQSSPKFPDPLQRHRVDLGGGLVATLPLSVYADASHTLPRAAQKAITYSTDAYTGNDRATRLGAVVIVWNVLQHFYPYFDVVDVDWPAELRLALRAAGEDRGEADFTLTLRRLIAALDDGHGTVGHRSMAGRLPLPILWRMAGDALVVSAVDASVTGVSRGDEVLAIDGKPALQALREAEALISGATPQWRRSKALTQVAAGNAGTSATLTIRNADATTRTVTLTRSVLPEGLSEKRPEKIAELQPGFWYVALDRINDADFEAALEKLAAARGIVFDLRGYPSTGTKPLRHLIDTVSQSARWNVPILRRPDREGVEWDTGERWSLQPAKPRLTKNVVFLTDGRAISYAESWMGIVEAYKLGTIVGETTAGTNGNINRLQVPGGYMVIFTGMKVLKHDGSRHHGVGIAPDVPVTPTIAGIRAGRDEQLEKALEILRRGR
ncbi:MAG TPA: S41 family peptidase [Thermoanaerobaculia bacterium]|jgi:C-terminal processing protease CtpA/Prc